MVCVSLCPSTVRRTVYSPGNTSGPCGVSGVRYGTAEIGYPYRVAVGVVDRRSHTQRCIPAVAGSGPCTSGQYGGIRFFFISSGVGVTASLLEYFRRTEPSEPNSSRVTSCACAGRS